MSGTIEILNGTGLALTGWVYTAILEKVAANLVKCGNLNLARKLTDNSSVVFVVDMLNLADRERWSLEEATAIESSLRDVCTEIVKAESRNATPELVIQGAGRLLKIL